MPEAAPRMFQEYRGRNYPVIAERGLDSRAALRLGGYPSGDSQWLALCSNCTNYYWPPFPLARARAPCNAGFFPPAAQLPLLARARERESGLAEISEPRFLEKKSLLTPERERYVHRKINGGRFLGNHN